MENTILTLPSPQSGTALPYEEQPPVAVRRPLLHRHGRLLAMLALSAVGIALGAAVIALPERGDLSAAAIAQTEGSFLQLMLLRLLQTGAILAAEYMVGYFALGSWLVWAAPLAAGLGAGLSAAYLCSSGDAGLMALLIPSAVGAVALCGFAADTSAEFSELLLRLVSGEKNSIVMQGSSAKGYTLRFGVYLAILLVLSIYEAAVKLISLA